MIPHLISQNLDIYMNDKQSGKATDVHMHGKQKSQKQYDPEHLIENWTLYSCDEVDRQYHIEHLYCMDKGIFWNSLSNKHKT